MSLRLEGLLFHIPSLPTPEPPLARMTLLAASVLALVGCAAAPAVPVAAAVGAGAGGAAGATVGSGSGKVASTVAGGIAGAWIGATIGQRLERDAQSQAMSAEQRAVNENVMVDWTGDNRTRGVVVPRRTFQDSQGRPCREFAHEIVIAGRVEQGVGVYCRENDGFWRLQGGAGTS
jgi:surface antigen